MPSPFIWTVRVYYEDTDAGGVVFYANYLKFFERARTEWLRAAGINQSQMTENHHAVFVVKSTALDYHMPARLDDELKLTVVVEKLGRASVQFVQEAWRVRKDDDGDRRELLATGRIKVGCVDLVHFRPTQIPQEVLANIQKPD
ncbi:tol-pal system-associated acyl-CoA thioesterase [uncultured Oxalicibacterium sp.]|uniref:tol-pal system-associated acyl-CoA thioesterase n=1 Tax=uncultured Oxalicibacterium sp. TaxID=1168540 RepID=UPI0025DFB90C|nr:tol-pal system-associated acyl-CoA thioesterase [uncultured Oxalicibacterium sp.]